MGHYCIEVEGEIIAYSKKHFAQNWACRSVSKPIVDKSYRYDKNTHSVKGNLILDENRRAVPYAVYYTKKGIRATENGEIVANPGCGASLAYFKENIAKIKTQLNAEIPQDVKESFYKGLFTDVFSSLELFLSDFVLSIIYSDIKSYNRAIAYYKLNNKRKRKEKNIDKIEKNMHKFFFDEVVYHAFDKVEIMFKNILNIEIPDTKDLRLWLHKRNNIVHRYSFSNIDRMGVCIVSKDDIERLLDVSFSFVEQLIANYDKSKSVMNIIP